jgi:hypothetical protein
MHFDVLLSANMSKIESSHLANSVLTILLLFEPLARRRREMRCHGRAHCRRLEV